MVVLAVEVEVEVEAWSLTLVVAVMVLPATAPTAPMVPGAMISRTAVAALVALALRLGIPAMIEAALGSRDGMD